MKYSWQWVENSAVWRRLISTEVYRVFQKFFRIQNYTLGTAFNASLGKFKLIQVRNLFKAI